jgi:radical SAM superfamily enzyme YgiQ (UPF0313 family)
MKTLFIYSNVNKEQYSNTYHFGIGRLSSILKEGGHKTSLFTLASLNQKAIINAIKKERPDIIGFTAVSSQIPYIKKIVETIKENFDIFTVCGGVHVTLVPESINELSVDAIVRSEGEYPILELANALEKGKDYSKIKNTWVRNNGKIVKNPLRPLVQNLDVLPFPDREIFDYQKILDEKRCAKFMFSRGCPYQCTYCANHALSKLYPTGNYLRLRSPENCIQEIGEVVANYNNIDILLFGNDSFNANIKWMRDFLKLYKKEFDIPFRCLIRPNVNLNNQVFKDLRSAGCHKVFMGIESGNEYIRNKVMKRGVTEKYITDAFKWASQNGIKTLASNIIGLPYETEDMLKDTIRLNAKVNANIMGLGIFYPYEGTELGNLCKKKGWIREDLAIKEREDSILELPNISRKKMVWYFRNFHYLAYRYQGNTKKALYFKAVSNKYIWKSIELFRNRMPLGARRKIKKLVGGVDY